jgi:hypothetical protein
MVLRHQLSRFLLYRSNEDPLERGLLVFRRTCRGECIEGCEPATSLYPFQHPQVQN